MLLRKSTLTYIIFATASLGVIVIFVTAKSYIQLGVAILLYPALAYFALKLFRHGGWQAPKIVIRMPIARPAVPTRVKREAIEVADIDKRTFLKLIGAAGLSFFVFSLLGRRVDNLLFGGSAGSAVPAIGTVPGNQTGSGGPSTTGYSIAEIDDGTITYYGFTNKDGAWLIMREDTETSSFRYAKGNSLFSTNWAKRENLKYSYYYELF